MEKQSHSVQRRSHIAYLDGLRGIAALWVVLYHFIGFGVHDLHSAAARFLLGWLTYGQLAVPIFIVLSGYLLQRQLVKNELNGGLIGFVKRRSRRIVPTYLIALTVTIILTGVSLHGLHHTSDLSFPSILTHYLLIHNWWPAYIKSISGPFWSVAVEWDIYFIFALLLLPIYRRYGITMAVLIAFVLSFAPMCLLPVPYNLSWSSPWFLGLFALGMAGCAYHQNDRADWNRHRTVVAVSAFLLVAEVALLAARHWTYWVDDVITGSVTITLIVYCGEAKKAGGNPFPLRLLSSRIPVGLAAFSYSLYLTHATFALKLHPIIERFHPSPELRCLFGVPETFLVLAGAYGFYWLAERPFTQQRSRA